MKKFRFNGKDNLILRVFITILGLLLISNISLANTARIEVKVIVPVMQRLVIKDPVALSFTYPWEGMESGQALIFNNVGNINVQSNVDWVLNISSQELYRELEIYLRPAGKVHAPWQRVDGFSAFVSGRNGSEDISWDIKIVGARNNHNTNDFMREMRTVNLAFTLTQL